MSEAVVETTAPSEFSWSRAVMTGAMATIVMTITMMLTGMNVMKSLGMMLLPEAAAGAQYAVGGVMHLTIGLMYGVVYAWLAVRITPRHRFVKGVVYGLALTGIALAVMPLMASMMGGGSASNPCAARTPATVAANPCAGNPCNPIAGKPPSNVPAKAGAPNPCSGTNPCAAKNATMAAKNPCAATPPCGPQNPCVGKNPCAAKPTTTSNPCAMHAQTTKAANACHADTAANPCGGAANPCNPCGGSQGPANGVLSALNHLVYALVLAFAYGRGR